jgi:hypothetical protein
VGLRPLLVQFATWRFVKEKGVGRVSYLLPQGVPRFLFCYPSTPLRAVVSQISTFLTVAYRRSITLVQSRMKVATAALIVKRLQAQDVARRAASQSATQSATQSASKDASKAEQVVTLTVKREGEELTTAAKRAEMAVKQEEKPMVAVKQEGEKPTTTAQSPLRIRVKVKTEAPTGKSLLNEVLEAPQWQQPDRSDASPR